VRGIRILHLFLYVRLSWLPLGDENSLLPSKAMKSSSGYLYRNDNVLRSTILIIIYSYTLHCSITLVLLLLASVYSFLHDSSESEYASESSDSGLAKNRLALMWSSVTGESGGVTSTQLSSFIRCCIEAMSITCGREENTIKHAFSYKSKMYLFRFWRSTTADGSFPE